MTVEIRPLGVKCNLNCVYCYQYPQRQAGNYPLTYDLEKIKAAVESLGNNPFTLFGGEALLMPEEDLEALWAWGYEKNKRNGIQTNGTLINDNHIRMFKQYAVHVGVSVDGPQELNDIRWAGNLKLTREMTARTQAALELLSKEKVSFSLIVTLHRGNAAVERLPRLLEWFRWLDSLGAASSRLHILEAESEAIRRKYALSIAENYQAFLSLKSLEKELRTLKFDVFRDMERLMSGDDNCTTCLWNACDPYTNRSVHTIEPDGQISGCGRGNVDGISFEKADVEGFERYLALYRTPQEHGGCAGCRFFLVCKGNCSGTAIDNDWRNRSEHCELWRGLFRHLEEEMLDQGATPITARPERQQVEQILLEGWAGGVNSTIASALSRLKQQQEAAQKKSSRGSAPRGGAHSDTRHGDAHGDHYDTRRR